MNNTFLLCLHQKGKSYRLAWVYEDSQAVYTKLCGWDAGTYEIYQRDGKCYLNTPRDIVALKQLKPITKVTKPVNFLWTYIPFHYHMIDKTQFECREEDRADTKITCFSEKSDFRVMVYLFHQTYETEFVNFPNFSSEKNSLLVCSSFPLLHFPAYRIGLAISDHTGGDDEFD
ncbi:hypothetical protein QUF90_22645 [Desulfococcaceae bacterium HSG9]|nr:hypothetical protein [Desulfococcaceae bacterium HSG9]